MKYLIHIVHKCTYIYTCVQCTHTYMYMNTMHTNVHICTQMYIYVHLNVQYKSVGLIVKKVPLTLGRAKL